MNRVLMNNVDKYATTDDPNFNGLSCITSINLNYYLVTLTYDLKLIIKEVLLSIVIGMLICHSYKLDRINN